MSFKVAQKFSVVLSKNNGSYKFELYIFGTLIPVIMTPANQVEFSDSKLSFDFNIQHDNMIMETGIYKIELLKHTDKTQFHELNLFKDKVLIFSSPIDSNFEDGIVKATFMFPNDTKDYQATIH